MGDGCPVLAWNPARHQQSARAPQVERIWAPADAQLIDAQNAGNAQALAQALQQGANPNLLADSGSSVLMLAAHRGQQEHVELLLQAGAQVDFRQTQKTVSRATPPCCGPSMAATLAWRNGWCRRVPALQAPQPLGLGPRAWPRKAAVCPCLAWLQGQGQSLVEPAPGKPWRDTGHAGCGQRASGRFGVVAAQGVDLWSRDAHGKTALDWAQFGKQADAVRWLQSASQWRLELQV